MIKLIKTLAAVAPDSRALARSRQFNETGKFHDAHATRLGSHRCRRPFTDYENDHVQTLLADWQAPARCDLRLGRSDRNLSFCGRRSRQNDVFCGKRRRDRCAQAPVTSSPGAAAATATAADTSIRPFHIRASDEALADLRRRIAATKWPKQKTVTDASQGVQLATMRELARHWEKDYDWRKVESTLNALPQFTTNIDGVEIHFIHVPIALSRARCVSIASNRT